MYASATFQETTELSGAMSEGRTMPCMRTNSLPELIAIHFSPRTSRLPLAKRLATVTLSAPSSALLCLLAPLPLKLESLFIEPSRTGTPFTVTGRPKMVGPVMVASLVLLVLVVTDFSALVLSSSRMVSVSPTLRAVTFCHSRTSVPCW